jgi:hypothetical protein
VAVPRPTVEPQSLVAGDTLQFDKTVSNFSPVDGWALSYILGAPDLKNISISGSVITSTGITFNINVPAATTKTYVPAKYSWAAFVTGSGTYAGQRFNVAQGQIEIKPNPAGQNVSFDTRSWAKRNLDLIDKFCEDRSAHDVQMYRIGGREITKMSGEEVLKWRAYFEQRVKQERIAAGESFPSTTIGAYFGPVRN